MRSLRFLTVVATLACCLTASAYDLKLVDGRVLKDIRLRKIEPTGIIVRVGDGMEFVDYSKMAEESDKLTFGFVLDKYEAALAQPAPAAQVAQVESAPPAPAPAPIPRPQAPRTSQAVATQAPATSTQCSAITKKGTQCSRRATPGTSFCWQHQ